MVKSIGLHYIMEVRINESNQFSFTCKSALNERISALFHGLSYTQRVKCTPAEGKKNTEVLGTVCALALLATPQRKRRGAGRGEVRCAEGLCDRARLDREAGSGKLRWHRGRR